MNGYPTHNRFLPGFSPAFTVFEERSGQVISLGVRDATITDGGIGSGGLTVTVNDVAPDVTLTGPATAVEGETETYSFSVFDVGTLDTFFVSIQTCGTSATLSGATFNATTGSGSFECTFDLGATSSTVFARIADDDNVSGGATLDVTVIPANSPPTVTVANSGVTVDEGQTAANNGGFDDIDTGDVVTVTASIGTVTQAGTQSGTWNWSYDTTDGPDDSDTVTITATDSEGVTATATFDLTVNNVAPTAEAGLNQTVFRNELVSVDGTWIDPAESNDNPYAWTWDLDGDASPDSSGSASYGDTVNGSTTFALEGFYTLTFDVTDEDGLSGSDTVEIEVLNQAPDCSNVAPSIAELWAPNHKFESINVLGVTDGDGDTVSINIDSISQDEPVDTNGDGKFTPDGKGVGTDTAEVRAERSGTKKVPGDGRVYHIGFTADDGHGGTCSGEVQVGVPHDKGKKSTLVDGGAIYDSTIL